MSAPVRTDGEGIDLAPGGKPGRIPDRGSPRAARIAWMLFVPLLALVVVLQQASALFGEEGAGLGEGVGEVVPPPDPQLEYVARAAVKMTLGVEGGEALGASFVPSLEEGARRESDRLRAAMVAAEILGGESGLSRIAALRERWEDRRSALEERRGGADAARVDRALAEIGVLEEDAALLERVYRDGPGVLGDEEWSRLEGHHGWFASLARTHGMGWEDPERARLVRGGAALWAVLMVAVGGALVAGVAGLVLLVAGVIQVGSGRIRPGLAPPAPGGSVYLETMVVFLASFLGLHLVVGLLDGVLGAEGSLMAALAGQWVLVGVLLWPMARGASWKELKEGMGWTAPRGVVREVVAGVAGYLAMLPVFAVSVAVTVVIVLVWQAVRGALWGGEEAPAPPRNEIVDLVSSGDVWTLALLGLLATVWAPLVEESVMRGALYRHLRGRMSWWGAGVATAVVFGLMHGYAVFLLLPVVTLGFGLALIREWRGSVVGCMAAHALHNGAVMALLITLVVLLRM